MAVTLTREKEKTQLTTFELLEKDARAQALEAGSQMKQCEVIFARAQNKNRIHPDVKTNTEVQAEINYKMAQAKFIVKRRHWHALRVIVDGEKK